MSLWPQADALKAARVELNDLEDDKTIFDFSPLVGVQDGTNKVFQIPEQRIVPSKLLVFKNGTQLTAPDDYSVTDSKRSIITFVVAPIVTDEIKVTFSFVWLEDTELGSHLNRGANELGFATYHTGPKSVTGSEATDEVADIPDGLKHAIILLGAARAASSLHQRFSTKYDISSGDHSYSPSQIADNYEILAKQLREDGLVARDQFYQGQGTQYFPVVRQQGYVLPSVTPKR